MKALKTLIVEDDAISALVLRRTLENLGHSVVHAYNGAEAWDRLADEDFPLIISDWVMPELNGVDLCRRIRACANRPYPYILLLTVCNSKANHREALEAGADDFLVKPLEPNELFARLQVAQRILAMQEELRDHATQMAILHKNLERQRCELEIMNARLSELATRDSLTNLRNRRYFQEQLEQAFSFCQRQNIPLSVIMLDVDRFKTYNDTYGHLAGDTVLQGLADVLRTTARAQDVIARVGGEEFAVLLPGVETAGANAMAERIRTLLAQKTGFHQTITASFGVATHLQQKYTPMELMKHADQALYRAKAEGRNRVAAYEMPVPPVQFLPSSRAAGG